MSHALRPHLTFVALLLGSTAFASTRYVNVALATGANDGSSWANAHQGLDGLAVALAAATSGDEIWVATGTYLPTTTATRTISFQLKNGVTVYGGFNGTETLVSQRDPTTNLTTLSGDLSNNDGSAMLNDNSFHVINGAGNNSTAVLDGFTVRGGNSNGATGMNNDKGGGILCLSGASPTIRRCIFTSNRCTFGGGAGYINSSSPTFTDCTFDNNIGGSFGGAFDMATSVAATFERCTFTNNSAARAGGIEIFGSSPVKVFNSVFSGNTSTGGGGGGAIFISGSNAVIRNCTITGNSATSNVAAGILASGGAPQIVNCISHGNTGQAGAMANSSQINPSTLNVTYSLTPTAYTGVGNISGAPVFTACGPSPFRLSTTSPGIDAGNNAGVAAGTTIDLAGGPRFGDVPSVSDTGAGTAPIVDMGAFESSDCNNNGVADWCDIDSGTSLDANADGVPDDCQCTGGVPPFTYCTAKLNSQFCMPAIDFTGYASASNSGTFLITATNILNQKTGLLFYGYNAQAAPFQGGTLCVTSPIRRTPTMNSGGSASGTDCTGTFSFDFNARIASGIDPLIQVVGQRVNAQFWSRDPADPFTTNTTDAVEFRVCQ